MCSSPTSRLVAHATLVFSVTLIVMLVIIGGLIAFVVLEQQILDALSPAADWLRE